MKPDRLIVGAGASGLTAAIEAAERGWRGAPPGRELTQIAAACALREQKADAERGADAELAVHRLTGTGRPSQARTGPPTRHKSVALDTEGARG